MKFRINLLRSSKDKYLSLNYQYELSAAIYKIIDRESAAFASFLHNEGYMAFGQQFRLFTFSRIDFNGFVTHASRGLLEHYGQMASFDISFLIDNAAETFIKGLFRDQQIFLGDKVHGIHYDVASIEAVAPPVFQEKMQYRCLSPILVKRKREDGGEDYLEPNDAGYETILLKNLLSKTLAMSHATADYSMASISEISFSQQVLSKVYKKGVKMKQHTASETHVIGYMYEFELTAPAELQEIGYYAGFGHLGSQGFGCVGVI